MSLWIKHKMKKMMIHYIAFYCLWNEFFAYQLLDSFFSRNDVMMKRKNRNHCKMSDSYWLTKEWIVNCCLSNLDEKFSSIYRNSSLTISFTDLLSHDLSRSLWESRSSIVTRLFSSDQAVFELCCYFDLISSELHTHLRAHWSLDDLEI
jgi:hypothetical protein